MSNSEAPVAPEFAPATAGSHTSGSAAPSGSGGSGLDVDDAEQRNQKIGAWVEAGATSVPAMLIAIASAAAGGVALAIRRRRGR